MTDFKTSKKAMYSTPFDVRLILGAFERSVLDDDDEVTIIQSIRDQKIEQHIYSADAIVWGYLTPTYSSSSLNSETPYFMGPVPLDDNDSSGYLQGVVVASTAITEQWLIKFTDVDTFSVYGSFSGSQGSGTIGADFITDNADIQIISADWDLGDNSTITVPNRFLFATYISHPVVRMLSSKLAAANLIDALYSVAESKQSTWSKALRKECMDFLKALVDPSSGVSLNDVNEGDVSPYEAVAWTIDEYGRDVTNYLDIDDDVNPFGKATGDGYDGS